MDQQGVSPGGPLLDWAVAGRALPGQAESGDGFAVVDAGEGALVALVDGLGHGPEAAVAARLAVATLQAHAGEPVEALVKRCHQALLKARGAVLSLASFRAADDTLSWLGVGNVEGVLLRADRSRRRESVQLRGGLVGYHLPPLHTSVVTASAGDTLVFATDGIHGDFIIELDGRGAPQEIADRVLQRHAKDADDATVLVARYRGRGA